MSIRTDVFIECDKCHYDAYGKEAEEMQILCEECLDYYVNIDNENKNLKKKIEDLESGKEVERQREYFEKREKAFYQREEELKKEVSRLKSIEVTMMKNNDDYVSQIHRLNHDLVEERAKNIKWRLLEVKEEARKKRIENSKKEENILL